MVDLLINRTHSTPSIEFYETGELHICGKALSEDPRIFFAPLLDWIKELSTDSIQLEIKLEYLNSSSTKMMNDFIKTIDANNHIGSKTIDWYFEEDDEDMLEAGQIFEENTLSTNFFFHEMAENVA